MLIQCLEGVAIKDIAQKYDVRSNTVITLRDRFEQKGLEALYDCARSGRPPTYGESFRAQVLATLEDDPPEGYAQWDGPLVARHLGVSEHAVWRLLRKDPSTGLRTP